jgi:tetratricopeptide (TPR) repeat protein
MKKITVVLGFVWMAAVAFLVRVDFSAPTPATGVGLGAAAAWAAPGQQAEEQKPRTWSGRAEYDAYQAMVTEKDSNKKIAAADAFLQKYPDSFVKEAAYITKMQVYAQLNDVPKAIEAARDTVKANPDSLQALSYLAFTFPFVFKADDDPDSAAKLSQAENDSRHGLEVLEKLKKPENVTDEQFNQYVKGQRANFNNTMGFVALQRKNYPEAITHFRAAAEDNPADIYTFYRMGLAYLYQETPDYDHAVWNLARSVSLAKASNNAAGTEISNFLSKVYVGFHGNEEGLPEIIAQTATSPTPPEGFQVKPMPVPEKTGNPSVDAFNQMAVPLKLGGPRAQEIWSKLKGQPVELAGFVDSVERASDGNIYIVHIDLLDSSKETEGVYDIELRDSTQPNVKNLAGGVGVHFKGTLEAYAATPNFVLTLENGEINPDEIPDQPAARPRRPRR